MEKSELDKWKEVGKMAADTMSYARKITKEGVTLFEIAENIDAYIKKKGAAAAFPISLSTKHVAAHYTPIANDKRVAEGLIKIDLGVSKDGYLSDTATSLDLTPEQKHKDLIKASEDALKAAIKTIGIGVEIGKVGEAIESAIKNHGFVPTRNLSGHSIEKWRLHAGITVPNFNNKNKNTFKEGIYASEPFATTGGGLVKEGGGSNIWILNQSKPTRVGREVLKYIEEEFRTLAFSSRWIVDKFGPGALFSLEKLKHQGILHHYAELVNEPDAFTTQSEHSIAIQEGKKTIILTERD